MDRITAVPINIAVTNIAGRSTRTAAASFAVLLLPELAGKFTLQTCAA